MSPSRSSYEPRQGRAAGAPSDLYEHPATEFVMSFVGEVNRRGSLFIRPHDVEISHIPAAGGEEAMIERIVHLGFEVRSS